MRKLLALIRLNLSQIRHDRGTLVSMTVLPIMLTILLGFMMGGGSSGKIPIAFVDADRSTYSRLVGAELDAQSGLTVKRLTAAEADAERRDNQLVAVVTVPKGFGQRVEQASAPATIEIAQANDPTRAIAVAEVVRGFATRMAADQTAARVALEQIAAARAQFRMPVPPGGAGTPGNTLLPLVSSLPETALERLEPTFPYIRTSPATASVVAIADKKWEPTAPISVKLVSVKAAKARGEATVASGFKQSSLGMTVWFVLMLLLGNAAASLEERENGTLPRLLTTPTPRAQILGGKVAGVYVTGVAQAAILIVFGALVFNVPWGSDPGAVALIMATYILAATGLSVMISSVVRTRGQASALGPVLAVSLSMLGGCAWPLDIVPPYMRTLALFTPPGWAMVGLTNVVVRGHGMPAALLPSLVLVGFAAVFFLVGLTRFRWE